MTVESTTTKQSFILNGVTKTFNFTFRALAENHIECQIISTTGDVEELTYETDYSVSLPTLGGTVTLEDADYKMVKEAVEEAGADILVTAQIMKALGEKE